jgi:hypothetical protein
MKRMITLAETTDARRLSLLTPRARWAALSEAQRPQPDEHRLISSELALAELSCTGLHGRADTQVIIGGLGLGFSLRRVLELVGKHALVQVAELLPEVVALESPASEKRQWPAAGRTAGGGNHR